jgi:hypothetical protein
LTFVREGPRIDAGNKVKLSLAYDALPDPVGSPCIQGIVADAFGGVPLTH